MAYSTGSGDYTAVMTAVLAHALGDGWTESGGLGTGWPIETPTNGSFFDWTSYTLSENDLTIGGGGGTKTQRYIRLGLGVSGANATSDAAATTTVVPNMAYTFSEYHIFSDPTISAYIHVVVKFSNGPNTDVYQNFSFGELDKGGLTYGCIAYATADFRRGYAPLASTGVTAGDWNGFTNWAPGFTGIVGSPTYSSRANLSFLVHSTLAPAPNNASGWPAHDVVVSNGASVWSKSHDIGALVAGDNVHNTTGNFFSMTHFAWVSQAPSQTGTITMMPLQFYLINSTGFSGVLRYAGVFPGIRKTNVKDVTPGDEIAYALDTWKIFPMSRKTSWALSAVASTVSSGLAGYAIKKVV